MHLQLSLQIQHVQDSSQLVLQLVLDVLQMEHVQLQLYKLPVWRTPHKLIVYGIQHVKKKHVQMHLHQIQLMNYVLNIYLHVPLKVEDLVVNQELVQMLQLVLSQTMLVKHIYLDLIV